MDLQTRAVMLLICSQSIRVAPSSMPLGSILSQSADDLYKAASYTSLLRSCWLVEGWNKIMRLLLLSDLCPLLSFVAGEIFCYVLP